MDLKYPLAEAARITGRPAYEIRCDILLGKLPAEAVDDDRQYLLRGVDLGLPEPTRNRWIWAMPIAILVLQFGWLLYLTNYSKTYYCADCARVRTTREILYAIPFRSRVEDSDLTSSLDRGGCGDHVWVYRNGVDYGGKPLRGPGYEPWRKAGEMRGDPEAARRVLRTGLP